jgi:sec-independent protein translocase protein TatA
MNLGTPELLVILVIVMLLFGARRIPDLMRGFGEGIKSFKEGMREGPSAPPPAPSEHPAPPAADKK